MRGEEDGAMHIAGRGRARKNGEESLSLSYTLLLSSRVLSVNYDRTRRAARAERRDFFVGGVCVGMCIWS